MWGLGPHYQGYSYGGEAYWATGLHLFTPLPYTSGELFRRIRLHGFINGGTLTECRKYVSLYIWFYLSQIIYHNYQTCYEIQDFLVVLDCIVDWVWLKLKLIMLYH